MMDRLIDFFVKFIGIFCGMALYDFFERKIYSIKSTPENNDEKPGKDCGGEV